jgi:hypothetical protein
VGRSCSTMMRRGLLADIFVKKPTEEWSLGRPDVGPSVILK